MPDTIPSTSDNRQCTSSSITTTTTTTEKEKPNETAKVLKLRQPPSDRKISWQDGTIDNEFMNKKKSKKCCIYTKPKEFGVSSTESDSSCEDNAYEPGKSNKKKRKKKKNCCQHNDKDDKNSEPKKDEPADNNKPNASDQGKIP